MRFLHNKWVKTRTESKKQSLLPRHHTLKVRQVTYFVLKHHRLYHTSITLNFGRTRDDICVEFKTHRMFFIQPIPGAISEILACVSDTGNLTIADRYGLMAAILDESLEDEDRNSMNRLLRSVLRGRVKMVNELSAMV